MQYVSREAVESAIQKIFFNNAKDVEIPVDVLIRSLIEEFNSRELNQEQRNRLGQHIFFNPDVMKQLEQSEVESEGEYIANYADYLKFKNEVANELR
ncbi:hypothetical protein [Paenibacillus koleovorans]|uniref:hypothetical protein n=1 Tax=Paenibacillus koleovorans TaxID=121608 RepID=UPI000FDACB6B|nr:hypothetical protein [Paenibacillus koleovorans]